LKVEGLNYPKLLKADMGKKNQKMNRKGAKGLFSFSLIGSNDQEKG